MINRMEAAREFVRKNSSAEGADQEELAKIVLCREATVAIMATSLPGTRVWESCSEEIARLESHLAPWGLV